MEESDANEEENSTLPSSLLFIQPSSTLTAGSSYKLAFSAIWHWTGNVIPSTEVTYHYYFYYKIKQSPDYLWTVKHLWPNLKIKYQEIQIKPLLQLHSKTIEKFYHYFYWKVLELRTVRYKGFPSQNLEVGEITQLGFFIDLTFFIWTS